MAEELLRPNGAGSETAITACVPDTGEAHWEDVDEEVSDGGDTIVREELTSYHRDLYAIPDPTGACRDGTINSVTVHMVVKCIGADEYWSYAKCSLKAGSTVDDGDEEHLSGVIDYHELTHVWTVNPDDSAAWEWTDIDSLEIGVNIKRDTRNTGCTQVWVVVDYTETFTPKSSNVNLPVGWTPTKQLNAAIPSSNNYPPGWTPSSSLLAALTSQQNYPPGWSPSASLLAQLLSEKNYPPGWSPAFSILAALSSQKNYPAGWSQDAQVGAWPYCVTIAIDHTKVDTEDQAAFPVYISGRDLPDHFWDNVKNDGTDILILDSSFHILKREVVSIDTGGKTLELHVKIPTLSHTTDTLLFLFYGNATAAEPNDTDTWDEHFKAVYHMNDLTTSTIKDSTSNGNDGTKKGANEPVEAAGQVGKAQDFDGSDDYVYTASTAITGANRTFEFLVYNRGNTSYDLIFAQQANIGTTSNKDCVGIGFRYGAPNKLYMSVGDLTDNDGLGTETELEQDVWKYVAGVISSSGRSEIFKDGVSWVYETERTTTPYDDSVPIYMGRWAGAYADMKLDESRISDTNRADSWIKTTHNTLMDSANFYAVGKCLLLSDVLSVGWTSEKQVGLSVQDNYPVSLSAACQLLASLSSAQAITPGWSSAQSLAAALSSAADYAVSLGDASSIAAAIQSAIDWLCELQDSSFKSNIIWRDLSDKLIAEQKKTSVHPYVEARVYDYQQGIKMLSWSRLYEGEEDDDHHGIAFDGQGSMHRIRIDGSTLYRQKVTSPDEESTYSSWTQVAADCSGPCAIAAQGARVYIFYRKTDNTIRKYYSPDYGANWTNAELSTYSNACDMAAAWWGTTDIVICVIANDTAEYGEINAIVLDTSDQSKAEYEDSDAEGHPLTDISGIAATFDTDRVCVVFSGKSTVGEYTFSALYRTELSDSYEWLDWTYFLEHSDDDDIACRYPDIHLPQDVRSYESMQLALVEKYTGVTAYKYPLLAHLVRGAEFAQSMFTEPHHFINISSDYGLRIATSDEHWWLERPDGVWRAARKPDDTLDLTPDILTIHQAINSYNKGYLKIILDNSRGQYVTPPDRGKEVRLRLGYRTEDGNESRDVGHYWISGWLYTSSQGRSTLTLICDDAWALADRWIARHTLRWNYDQE